MITISTGIGRGQMEVLEHHVGLKKVIYKFYVELFKDKKGFTVFEVPNANYEANYWLSTIFNNSEVTNGITRETLRVALEEENIESRPLWKPMHFQPIFRHHPYYRKSVAATLFETGLFLPSGCGLTQAECDWIKDVVAKLFKK